MREGRVAAGLVGGALATLASALILARRVRAREADEAHAGSGALDEKVLESRSGGVRGGGS